MRLLPSLAMSLALILSFAVTHNSSMAATELMADGNVGAFRIFLVLNNRAALADPLGRTLYTYAKDPTEKATCTGPCEQLWPPMLAGSGERGFDSFSVFARDDGRMQWAFEGRPLYYSVRDTAPGQADGHGADELWSIVVVAGHEM